MSWQCYFTFIVKSRNGIYNNLLVLAGIYKLSWWKHIFSVGNLWLHVLGKIKVLSPLPMDIHSLRIHLHFPFFSSYFDFLIVINISTLKVFGDSIFQIKPKVGTVCFGVAASQGALLLAGGEKGMRYAMPNARIMIHQPQSGCGVRICYRSRGVMKQKNLPYWFDVGKE